MSLAKCIDVKAQLILIMIILSVLIFGYIVLASELIFGPSDEIQLRNNFFEGAQDGIWYCFVMMSTVGFGDIVPKSTISKCISIIWMFLSLTLMSLLYAVVITNFTESHLTTPRPVDKIESQEDLAPFRVNSTLLLSTVRDRLNASKCLDVMLSRAEIAAARGSNGARRLIPGAILNANLVKEIALLNKCQALADHTEAFDSLSRPARFGPGPAEFRALLNEEVDVIVERPEVIQYYNNFHPDTRGRLQNVGPIFNNEGVGIGVRRAHPLLHRISLAVANVTRVDGRAEDAIRRRWFGEDPPANFDGNEYRKTIENVAVVKVPLPPAPARLTPAQTRRIAAGPVRSPAPHGRAAQETRLLPPPND